MTPFNILVLYVVDYITGSHSGFLSPEVIYYFSASISFSVVGIVLVVEEIGSITQQIQRRGIRRPEGVVCSVCGAVVRAGESKCRICGSSPLKQCPQCGTLMSISAEQCPKCNYRTA